MMFETIDFSDQLQSKIREHSIDDASISFLRYSVNSNYKATIGGQSYFARVYRPKKESINSILAEHDYLTHLKKCGVSVSCPISLINDSTIAKLNLNSDEYYFSFFEYIEGEHIRSEFWDIDFISSWGSLLGQIHNASKSYLHKNTINRHAWDELPWIKSFSPSDLNLEKLKLGILQKEWDDVFIFLNKLPKDSEYFGLIHYDFHPGNFIKSENGLTAIDFDDCCKGFYGWDFAMPLHRMSKGHMGTIEIETLDSFIKAYKKETSLPENIENNLRTFERIRHIFMLAWLNKRKAEQKWNQIFPRYLDTHIKYLLGNTSLF